MKRRRYRGDEDYDDDDVPEFFPSPTIVDLSKSTNKKKKTKQPLGFLWQTFKRTDDDKHE